MPIVSSPVATGKRILADAYNKLRMDVLANHNHDGVAGAYVDHKDLTDTAALTGVFHTHEDIELHINGGGGVFEDVGGGREGVHGLPSGIKVMGFAGYTVGTQAGTSTFYSGVQWVMVTGEYHSHDGSSGLYTIPYGYTFSAPPYVMVTCNNDEGHTGHWAYTHTVTTTQFQVVAATNSVPDYINWVAMGPRA